MTGIMCALAAGAGNVSGFTAAASPSTLTWAPNGGYYDTGNTTATPTGGLAPYTYVWEMVSGVGGPALETNDTTNFNSIITGAAVARCLVTDANSVSAYTNNVSIS